VNQSLGRLTNNHGNDQPDCKKSIELAEGQRVESREKTSMSQRKEGTMRASSRRTHESQSTDKVCKEKKNELE